MKSIDDLRNYAKAVDIDRAAEEVVEWICNNVDTFIDNHNREFVVGFSSLGIEYMHELQGIEREFLDLGISDSEISMDSGSFVELAADKFDDEQIERAKRLIDGYRGGAIVDEDEMREVKDMIGSLEKTYGPLDPERQKVIDDEAERLEILYGIIDSIKERLTSNKQYLERIYNKLIFYYELCGFREGQKVERNLEGYAKIDEFSFYPYDLPVSSTAKIPRVNENGEFELDENGNIIVDIGESVVKREPPQYHVDISIDFWEKRPQMAMF